MRVAEWATRLAGDGRWWPHAPQDLRPILNRAVARSGDGSVDEALKKAAAADACAGASKADEVYARARATAAAAASRSEKGDNAAALERKIRRQLLRDRVREHIVRAYDSYMYHAYPAAELRLVCQRFFVPSLFNFKSI